MGTYQIYNFGGCFRNNMENKTPTRICKFPMDFLWSKWKGSFNTYYVQFERSAPKL